MKYYLIMISYSQETVRNDFMTTKLTEEELRTEKTETIPEFPVIGKYFRKK